MNAAGHVEKSAKFVKMAGEEESTERKGGFFIVFFVHRFTHIKTSFFKRGYESLLFFVNIMIIFLELLNHRQKKGRTEEPFKGKVVVFHSIME